MSPGPPAFDCEQLTVHAGGPAEGDTAPLSPPLAPAHRTTTGAVHLVNLTATVIRCVPAIDDDGDAPAASDLTDAARVTLADVWAIWNVTRRRHQDGVLFPPAHRELVIDPAFPVQPSGALAGWQVSIRVSVPGYLA